MYTGAMAHVLSAYLQQQCALGASAVLFDIMHTMHKMVRAKNCYHDAWNVVYALAGVY